MAKIKRFNGDDDESMVEGDASVAERMGKKTKPEITTFTEKTGVKGDGGNRIVSKKELADSGLTLNQFLNRERGLTARNKPEAKPTASASSSDYSNEGRSSRSTNAADRIPGQSAKAPESSGGESSTETSRNIEAALAATGAGAAGVKGYKMYKAAQAAKAAKAPMEMVAKKASEIAAKGREEVTNPLMWMAGPKKASKFKEPKKGLSEADTSGGAIGYKRGGGVSSASSRADGIAQRGKTKGRMY
jgi:hypothetical protein